MCKTYIKSITTIHNSLRRLERTFQLPVYINISITVHRQQQVRILDQLTRLSDVSSQRNKIFIHGRGKHTPLD